MAAGRFRLVRGHRRRRSARGDVDRGTRRPPPDGESRLRAHRRAPAASGGIVLRPNGRCDLGDRNRGVGWIRIRPARDVGDTARGVHSRLAHRIPFRRLRRGDGFSRGGTAHARGCDRLLAGGDRFVAPLRRPALFPQADGNHRRRAERRPPRTLHVLHCSSHRRDLVRRRISRVV